MTSHPTPDPAVLEQARDRLRPVLASLGEGTLLIGLDVDGTLVDHDGRMDPAMRAILQSTAEQHEVVIATGRSVGATLPIVEAAGISRGFAVCSNGAVTLEFDPSADGGHRVIDTQPFQPGPALARLREAAPDAHYAVELPDGSFHATPGFQDRSFGVEAKASSIDDLMRLDAVRVVVHVPDLTPEEFSEVVRDSGVHGVEYAIGWTAWLDMAAPGVSKASALEAIRQRLDIPTERTLAVGDGFNDTEMLQWAQVGVAMGQAPDGVKEIADVTTATVFENGTVLVLEGLRG